MTTKLCYKCKIEKQYEEFNKDVNGKYGLSSKCKICSAATFREYYLNNKDYHKQLCKQDVQCPDCLETHKKSAKASHYKTRKHKIKSEKIQKMMTLEGIIENT